MILQLPTGFFLVMTYYLLTLQYKPFNVHEIKALIN